MSRNVLIIVERKYLHILISWRYFRCFFAEKYSFFQPIHMLSSYDIMILRSQKSNFTIIFFRDVTQGFWFPSPRNFENLIIILFFFLGMEKGGILELIIYPSNLPVIESDKKAIGFSEKLSDLIGNKYKNWEEKEIVFIQASTGLGKSFAVIHFWYEYAKSQGMVMAVLVNRKLLKEQQWVDVREHDLQRNECEVHLHLFTYQQLEGDGEEAKRCKRTLMKCRFIICDECHYFLSDATFNSGVQRSFDFITSLYETCTLIFLSATIEQVRPQIEKRICGWHEKTVEKWKIKKQRYEEDINYQCRYQEYGEECDLLSYAMRLEAEEASDDYKREMDFYEKKMQAPRVREYLYLRNISENIDVRYFVSIDELIQVICSGRYDGKWLIFVSSKKVGKEICETLQNQSFTQEDIVFVDADYDKFDSWIEPDKRRAYEEVRYIIQRGCFRCKILVTTAVLDNGTNLKDSNLTNIVLMTDDEVEFKQMLGRRRLMNDTDKFNLFISIGKRGTFENRRKFYHNLYWEISDNREITVLEAEKMLLKDPVHVSSFLQSYYDRRDLLYHANELALEKVRERYLFCKKISEGLVHDKNFFLREQMSWIGKKYSDEWVNNANIGYTKEEIDEIMNELDRIYHIEGIINKHRYDGLATKLMHIAAKIDHTNFAAKSGNVTTVNKALNLRDEWSKYHINPIGDRVTCYEILRNNIAPYQICDDFTLDKLRQFIANNPTVDMATVWEFVFEKSIPSCMIEESKTYLNAQIKKFPGLGNIILKSTSDGKLILSQRPNAKNRTK